MNKNIAIWVVAAVLVIVAIGTVQGFNANTKLAEEKNAALSQTEVTAPTVSATASNGDSSTEKTLAPDFALKDLSGKTVKLSDLRGKKVYINFWATWCGYCVEEMPDIQKIYTENKDNNLVVLAVNVAESGRMAKAFMDKNKLSFTVLLDGDGSVASKQYGVGGFPTSIFVNSDGTISSSVEGMMSYESMKSAVDDLK